MDEVYLTNSIIYIYGIFNKNKCKLAIICVKKITNLSNLLARSKIKHKSVQIALTDFLF